MYYAHLFSNYFDYKMNLFCMFMLALFNTATAQISNFGHVPQFYYLKNETHLDEQWDTFKVGLFILSNEIV